MRHPDQKINSIPELINVLKQTIQPNDIVWYRGQADNSWGLTPTLSRTNGGIEAEIALMKRFKQNAIPLASVKPMSEWEWLFLMQHYGLPTRLLDWTESPLVGLYFAIESHPDKDGALWCLLPIKLNENANISYSLSVEIPCFEVDEPLDNYLPQKIASERTSSLKPIAAMAMRDNPRVFAQMGSFTITHREQIAIETIGDNKHIWRFIIPKEFKEEIRKELAYLRITKLTLFPELENVALVAKEVLREVLQ